MKIAAYLLPVLFLAVILVAAIRRVRVYDSFASGAAGALPLLKSLFPYIAAILVLSELFEASGLSQAFSKALSPLFSVVGIPSEISSLVLIKPFSGSGSLALVSDVCARYGADSYIARCACVLYASGETVFISPPSILQEAREKTPAPSLSLWPPISAPPFWAAFFAVFFKRRTLYFSKMLILLKMKTYNAVNRCPKNKNVSN